MRVYYGWWIVSAAVLINTLLVGSTFQAFGLFVLPVSEEFGLSRAEMNTGLILLNLGGAAAAPFLGRMLDRVRAKWIMIACSLLFGICLTILGLSRSLWLSAAVLTVPLAAAIAGSGTLTAAVLVARWFTAQRGRAMALAFMGISLAGVLVTPLAGLLIAAEGWRAALLTIGGAVTALLLAIALLLRDRPGPGDVERGRSAAVPADAPRDGAPAKVWDILRMPQFWLIGAGASLALSVGQAIAISMVPLALEEGISMLHATSLVSVAGGAALVGKLLLAVVADKVDRIMLLTGAFGLGAILNLALLASEGYLTLLGCSLILGATTGALLPLFNALLADRFGAASFGTVRGLMAPVVAVGGALAIRFAGEVYDRTGDYDLMFSSFIAVEVVAAGLMFAARFARPVSIRATVAS